MNIMITVVQNYSFTEIIAGISIIIDFAKLILFEVGVVIWYRPELVDSSDLRRL